jgi:hypothetical protein
MPTKVDMAVKATGFVLRQEQEATQATVDAVGKCEIDNAVVATKWHCWFSPIAREWIEPCPLTACQNDRHYIFHAGLIDVS